MALKLVRKSPVRMGVVGCGVVADYGHIPAIHRCKEAKLVGFADPDEARREAQSRKYGAPCFESFEEMAEKVEMDAVAIPTHPAVKLRMVRIAVRHGLHAFCEKPLSDTVADAEEIVRLTDRARLFVGVAFVYRGKEVVQRMMELAREGTIGRLRAVRIENLWDYHGLRSEAWGEHFRGRRSRALRNLGTLDCGVHDLDLARYMTGADFKRISAVGTIVEKANIYPDHIMVHASMTNGAIVNVEESGVWGYTAKERPKYIHGYHMLGEKGLISTRPESLGEEKVELYVVSGKRQWSEKLGAGKAWDETYRQFFLTILGRRTPNRFVADGHDALANMRAAREVIEQCEKGMAGRAKTPARRHGG